MSLPFAPDGVADITPAWLTSALAASYPGAEVLSAHAGTVIHGTATKVRLMLEYNAAGHAHRLPPTLWFKGGLEGHSTTDDMLIVYAGEASFFREIAGTLDLDIPRALAAAIDPATNRSYLLLEDLLARNASFGTALRPMTPAQAAVLVAELAKLHAAYWRSPKLDAMTWLRGGGSLLQSCEVLMTEPTWERCIALPRGAHVPRALRDFRQLRGAILHALRSDVERANCFVHGDSHIGNTFSTPDGGGGFVDWQSTSHGFWAHDVAYFIITALTPVDRRHAARDLLAHYIAQLRDHGVTLDEAEAWLEYRRHAIYSCAWSMCLPEWQREEVCSAVVERAFAAVTDLRTLEAW